ncbi:MAG: zf-HC2 domain-containing protein [Candidatus Eremiobacteraeota bacterium]|nr:zf-HC2 domain-containing protein [Candidatus Eremiobacteraeota bacterium]MBV9737296.1 zf-HC2 domain-containing protein [Candidatus Eremiobacteraeota bacterium]
MRCSHCRPLLGAYVDHALTHRARYHVVHHLRNCAFCRSWLEEVRAIDGLLATPPAVEPKANFTHAVMAEVRSMPIPYVHRTNPWLLLCAYMAVAWIIMGAWLKISGLSLAGAFTMAASGANHLSLGLRTLAEAAQHAFGSTTPAVAAAVAGVLLLDALLGAAFFAFYTIVRPRLAAELAYARKV